MVDSFETEAKNDLLILKKKGGNMKRILMSLFTIASVAALSISATGALFSDTAEINGNTLSTGTLDIVVNDEGSDVLNPFYLTDMKPGYVKYGNLKVDNANGSNPANITKKVIIPNDVGNLSTQILYGLSVEIKKNGIFYWKQAIYNYDVTLNGVNNSKVFLGMLPADTNTENYVMYVTESYKMKDTADNTYQDKTLVFNIEIMGEQLSGNLVLENKTGEPNWDVIQDGIKGTLSYGVMDSTFKGTFTATGLPAGDYSLIKYNDPWPGAGSVLLNTGVSSGGSLTITFDQNLGSFSNAKIWLVKSSDFNGSQMIGWHPADYLFETGLVDYIKS